MAYLIQKDLLHIIHVYVSSKQKGSSGLMDKVSVSQPRNRGFELHTGHDYDSSYDTSTGLFQEADSRVIQISCQNLLYNRAKINKSYQKFNDCLCASDDLKT